MSVFVFNESYVFVNVGEANKMTNDLRYKLKKSEQEVAALSTSVARLETQVARFKTATEEAEKLEEELKSDKRKAQREV